MPGARLQEIVKGNARVKRDLWGWIPPVRKARREIARLSARVDELESQRGKGGNQQSPSFRAQRSESAAKKRQAEQEERIGFLSEFLPINVADNAIFVSLKHRYIHVSTPKVGCSSIKRWLQAVELEEPNLELKNQELHFRDLVPLLRPSQIPNFRALVEKGSFFRFVFVRNPYTRVYSAFLDKMRHQAPLKLQILQVLGVEDPDYQPGFEEFLGALSKIPGHELDIHVRPQYDQCMFSVIPFDFIGRFERFQDDAITAFRQFTEQSIVSEHRPHSTQASQKIRTGYTPACIELVNSIYAKDFENLGYQMVESFPKADDELERILEANEDCKV